MPNIPTATRKPTIEFDGELTIRDDKIAPCAVQIWFGSNLYDPMTITVLAPEITDDLARPTQIVSGPVLYCSRGGCKVKLEDVRVRSWTSRSKSRRHLYHEVVLADVRRMVVSWRNPTLENGTLGGKPAGEPLVVKLSESAYLSPIRIAMPSDKGVLKFEHRDSLKANHPTLGTVRFERRYRYSPLPAQDVQVSSELVAVVKKPLQDRSSRVDSASAAEALEDFCLLASVASRHRIQVRGWRLESADAFEDAFINPLESGAGLPKLDERDVLIRREHASTFLSHCIKAWRFFNEAEVRKLRHACYALASISEPTLEERFLMMFAALEGLVSIFRTRRGGDFVFSKKRTWSLICKKLSEAVDSIAVDDPQFNPDAIKRNLPALRRVPLEESTKSVLTELGAWSNALWPLFDSKGNSIASIRNLLAHGEQLAPSKMDAVMLAETHLQTILERTFCCALGWPLAHTSVSDGVMLGQERQFARDIVTGRAILSGTVSTVDTPG